MVYSNFYKNELQARGLSPLLAKFIDISPDRKTPYKFLEKQYMVNSET
jgi:hypothetical protein